MSVVFDYKVGGHSYSVSLDQLRSQYHKIFFFDDNDFMENLPEVLHYVCFFKWLQKDGHKETLSDKGLLHELIHLQHIPNEPLVNLFEIREKFHRECDPRNLKVFQEKVV